MSGQSNVRKANIVYLSNKVPKYIHRAELGVLRFRLMLLDKLHLFNLIPSCGHFRFVLTRLPDGSLYTHHNGWHAPNKTNVFRPQHVTQRPGGLTRIHWYHFHFIRRSTYRSKYQSATRFTPGVWKTLARILNLLWPFTSCFSSPPATVAVSLQFGVCRRHLAIRHCHGLVFVIVTIFAFLSYKKWPENSRIQT